MVRCFNHAIAVTFKIGCLNRISNTARQILVTVEDADGKPLKVPGAFLLGIPVFRGGDAYQLPVRLRYRVVQGSVQWSYELHQPQRILDHALAEACAEVTERCSLDVLDGVPE